MISLQRLEEHLSYQIHARPVLLNDVAKNSQARWRGLIQCDNTAGASSSLW
jgi:hypothetical protein